MSPISFPIETERLLIRPMTADDTADFEKVYDGDRAPDEIGARIREQIELQERLGYSAWAVCERTNGRTIGYCGLKPLDGEGPEVELVYRMARPVRGRGLATEAGRACLIAGFDDLGLERIVAVADPENVAARRVLKKLGMTLMGIDDGARVRYAITREEEAAAEARVG